MPSLLLIPCWETREWETIQRLRKGKVSIFLAQKKLVFIKSNFSDVIFRPQTDFVDLYLGERWKGEMNDFYTHLAIVYKCNILVYIPTSNLPFKNNEVLHLKTDF